MNIYWKYEELLDEVPAAASRCAFSATPSTAPPW